MNLKIETCGSFRRGNMECGDVDMLITSNSDDDKNIQDILVRLVKQLEDKKFLVERLG